LAETEVLNRRAGLSPFDLTANGAYLRWREEKLAGYPKHAEELVVQVKDPRSLTRAEHEAMLRCIRKCNVAIYQSAVSGADKALVQSVGRQFGLDRLDTNWLADEDGITQVTVSAGNEREHYIPYTNQPIKWHTDGYYNPPSRRIWAMLLHCVRSAASGGGNGLLDQEIAYLLMRDADPELVHALMAEDAMTIPPRQDEGGIARGAQTGPVFMVSPENGALHMRYTARTRSIEWKCDAATRAAVAWLERLFAQGSPYIFRVRLEPGMGIVSNNVLHDRERFEDDSSGRRLLYRARYYDCIQAASQVPQRHSA
jgi:hypothetical protein